MPASRNDQALLASDATFQGRVKAALGAACVAITNEGWAVVFHEQRMRLAVKILNTQAYTVLFSSVVATDANVIADATGGGIVPLTVGNVASQAAAVTDAHIDNAVSAMFNSFLVPLQNA